MSFPQAVPAARYALPDLDYDFGALEPHISGKIMELHHGKHHAGYVKNINLTITLLEETRATEDFTRLEALERALAFNLSGHVLHSILWKNMTPKGGDRPDGALAHAIDENFGSFEKLQIYDHQSNLGQGGVPLMVIDAWEHAYYLQYQNEKRSFFEATWHLWNWNDVAERFAAARRLNLLVPGSAGG